MRVSWYLNLMGICVYCISPTPHGHLAKVVLASAGGGQRHSGVAQAPATSRHPISCLEAMRTPLLAVARQVLMVAVLAIIIPSPTDPICDSVPSPK